MSKRVTSLETIRRNLANAELQARQAKQAKHDKPLEVISPLTEKILRTRAKMVDEAEQGANDIYKKGLRQKLNSDEIALLLNDYTLDRLYSDGIISYEQLEKIEKSWKWQEREKLYLPKIDGVSWRPVSGFLGNDVATTRMFWKALKVRNAKPNKKDANKKDTSDRAIIEIQSGRVFEPEDMMQEFNLAYLVVEQKIANGTLVLTDDDVCPDSIKLYFGIDNWKQYNAMHNTFRRIIFREMNQATFKTKEGELIDFPSVTLYADSTDRGIDEVELEEVLKQLIEDPYAHKVLIYWLGGFSTEDTAKEMHTWNKTVRETRRKLKKMLGIGYGIEGYGIEEYGIEE